MDFASFTAVSRGLIWRYLLLPTIRAWYVPLIPSEFSWADEMTEPVERIVLEFPLVRVVTYFLGND